MADVRSLLRAERQTRRITHPHASYTGDGKLLCNLCETLVKSEAHWQSHLHSTQHNLRSQRQKDVAASRGEDGVAGAKKRKAESSESPPYERKKARAEPVSNVGQDGRAEEGEEVEVEATAEDESVQHSTVSKTQHTSPPPAAIDETDLTAFERELDALEADAVRQDQEARRAAATISAAPMTAEQLAAQAREEQSAQRGKRDVELEEDREDAARVLEDEMDEMEGLEERVRRLRERREMLRGSEGAGEGGGGTGIGEDGEREKLDGSVDGEEQGESSDEEEDVDEWKFGGS